MRCWHGYLSGARCRLACAQLMPLPLTVSCFSKIQIGFTFLVPAHLDSPGQRAVKRVCVCVCLGLHDPVHDRPGVQVCCLAGLQLSGEGGAGCYYVPRRAIPRSARLSVRPSSRSAAALGYRHAGCLQLSRVRTANPSADGRRSAASRTAIGGGHIVSPLPGR